MQIALERKEMYRTLLVGVWLSSGRSNVKVPHLALQGVSTEFVLIETHQKGNVPPVASNVRYIAFSMRTNTLLTQIKARYFHVTPNS